MVELIHADSNLVELNQVINFSQWDLVASLKDSPDDNDFQLNLSESDWLEYGIAKGDYLYEPGTEFGGRVLGIKHVDNEIQITGRTWRGMLIDKIIKPPGGSAYKTITTMEANAAISDLLGSSMGTLFTASAAASGITVSGSFRYQTLLYGLHRLLNDSNARLAIGFADGVVTLSAMLISDLSDDEEFSQDNSAPIQSLSNDGSAYNHVVALGSGELTARQVVELYRDAAGVISATPLPAGIDDRQVVLNYPNVESLDELTAKATELLALDYAPVETVEIDLPENAGHNLGDIVGGRDYVTGLSITTQITQIIRTVNQDGVTVQYKVGE